MNHLKYIIFLVKCVGVFFCMYSQCMAYTWTFPRDHGAHHEFSTEWWYFTGHLSTDSLATYGFELTFFRVDSPFESNDQNSWTIDHIYLAHFALTDDAEESFYYAERINRDSFKMAGASLEGLHVWNGDWRAEKEDDVLTLEAQTEGIHLNLSLDTFNTMMLHGDNGYSVKDWDGSQASYYYSMPRLEGAGTLIKESKTEQISLASVWFDHEFFNQSELVNGSLLAQDSSEKTSYDGWDWFALQFENGDQLMFAQVRTQSDQKNHYYFGTFQDASGHTVALDRDLVTLNVLDTWQSKATKRQYPSLWSLTIPSLEIDVIVTPTVHDQELKLHHLKGVDYWEGRCRFEGTHQGNAYVELVGYEPIP